MTFIGAAGFMEALRVVELAIDVVGAAAKVRSSELGAGVGVTRRFLLAVDGSSFFTTLAVDAAGRGLV